MHNVCGLVPRQINTVQYSGCNQSAARAVLEPIVGTVVRCVGVKVATKKGKACLAPTSNPSEIGLQPTDLKTWRRRQITATSPVTVV